jgi:ribosomal protein S18 acetylase RimI-like enzyme
MSTPAADVSVRIAWADDAAAIAALQLRAWRTTYAGLVPAGTLPDDADAVADAWRASLAASTDARNRVLVALERNRVVGFAITTPATDPDCDQVTDGELMELTVDAAERGRGHGSRLLQAAADTMVADRFTRAVTWLVADDDAQRTFLGDAGWAPDGAHRTLDLDGTGATQVKQVRLHTALA